MAENKNRWKIQALSTLLTNAHLTGFFTGKIFKGNLKGFCVPGLNCYSCPGAIGSCPIGSLQAVIGSSKFCFSYYVVGIIILFGVLLGRVICGFLCPFGWFQELLHKIPTKKFSTKKLYFLTYGKYMILLLFVIVLPMTMVNEVGMGDPWFCKWFCPLGAFYALFNQVSLYCFHIDRNKCTACGACAKACKMDVEVYKTPNHTECIRCGDCLRTCPYGAISKTIPFSKGVNQHEETT